MAARQRAGREQLGPHPQLGGHDGALVDEVVLVHRARVPLVEHERRGAALLHRQLGDAQVLAGDPVGRVADDERDVGALDRPLRAQRRVVLDGVLDLGLAAQAGGVDEDQLAPVDLHRQVDRVARGARDVGDDHALRARDAVDERRLADVRAPDHGEADDVLLLGGDLLLGGQHVDERVEQVAGAQALRGRHGDRVAQAQRVELVGEREVADGVDLVRGDQHRPAAPAAQQVAELLVARAPPGARVDHQHRGDGVGERGLRLLADRAGDRVGVQEVHAAGVDERERAPVPLAVELVAVAGDARRARARPRRASPSAG